MLHVLAYVVSPLATLLAVYVAYLALLKRSEPQLLVYYRPNPDIQSFIDLVIENIGGGSAIGVTFSKPLPVSCFGIEKPQGEGASVSKEGFPAIAPGQRYVFDGGQFAGLEKRIGAGLTVEVTYKYKKPLGRIAEHNESFILSLTHLSNMPTRTSADQAIVDALTSSNRTTIHDIRNELHAINNTLQLLVEQNERISGGSDA